MNLSLFKMDGWTSVLSGLGGKSDKTKSTNIGAPCFLDERELNDLWIEDGLAKMVVTAFPDDMTREGFTVPEDTENTLVSEFQRRGFAKAVILALYWARLQGGSIIIKHYEGDGLLDTPATTSQKTIKKLVVYAKDSIEFSSTDIVTDPTSPYFDQIEYYNVRSNNTGTPFKVHASRVIEVKGEPCPKDSRYNMEYRYWGLSAIQAGKDQLVHLEGGLQGISHLLQEVVIGKYTITGLAKILSDKDGVEKVYRRLEVINASKSIINGVLLGENEKYERDSITFSGVPDVVDRLMMMVSAVYGYPVTRLFGRSPAGQNSTGESDLQNYYDKVVSQQKDDLLPIHMDIMSDLNAELKVIPETELTIKYNPVWTPSEKDLIDMRKKQAETDKIYMETGVLDAEEVQESRFTEAGYSFETTAKSVPKNPEEPTED